VPRIAQQVANCTASSLSLQNQPCRCFSDLCVPATCGRSLRAICSSDLSSVLQRTEIVCPPRTSVQQQQQQQSVDTLTISNSGSCLAANSAKHALCEIGQQQQL